MGAEMGNHDIRVTTASDYATLSVGHRTIYYGYEFAPSDDGDADDVWGLELTDGNTALARISYDDLRQYPGCPDQFATQECLIFGIGVLLLTQVLDVAGGDQTQAGP